VGFLPPDPAGRPYRAGGISAGGDLLSGSGAGADDGLADRLRSGVPDLASGETRLSGEAPCGCGSRFAAMSGAGVSGGAIEGGWAGSGGCADAAPILRAATASAAARVLSNMEASWANQAAR
jgi:hypothetical protein